MEDVCKHTLPSQRPKEALERVRIRLYIIGYKKDRPDSIVLNDLSSEICQGVETNLDYRGGDTVVICAKDDCITRCLLSLISLSRIRSALHLHLGHIVS